MFSILKYILLTALRDRLYIGLFIILSATFGISVALGDASLVEKSQATIVYVAGSSRIIFVIGIILFICFYVRKTFDNREVEFILSKPISRHKFILAYLLGFILVALFIILPLVLLLFFMKVNLIGLLYWSLSLFCEVLIIITFSLLAALILKSAVSSVLASLGFYILSRMMGFFVMTINIPQASVDFSSTQRIMNAVLKAISVSLPRLDLYTKSDWLIYGVGNFNDTNIIIWQFIIYTPLMIFMAFYDFNRKQF